MIRIHPLDSADDARLDAFVMSAEHATLFHTASWRRAVARAFPFEPIYLAAEDLAADGDATGEIVGCLPLFRVKNLFVAPTLISTPFAVYGGALGSANVRSALVREARALADRSGARFVELRNRFGPEPDVPVRSGYATFVKDLPEDPEQCLETLPRKARAAARKGIASGLEAIETRDDLAAFHHLFAVNKRHLGSPAIPMRLFLRLFEEFKDQVFLLMVRHRGTDVAGVLTFTFRDEVVPYYSGDLPAYERLQVNNFMYLRLMEWGVRHGFKRFDFGRSRIGSGSSQFKIHQGFAPTELPYQILSRNSGVAPDLSPSNPRFGLPMAIWRRLPLSVTKLVGPLLVRYFA